MVMGLDHDGIHGESDVYGVLWRWDGMGGRLRGQARGGFPLARASPPKGVVVVVNSEIDSVDPTPRGVMMHRAMCNVQIPSFVRTGNEKGRDCVWGLIGHHRGSSENLIRDSREHRKTK